MNPNSDGGATGSGGSSGATGSDGSTSSGGATSSEGGPSSGGAAGAAGGGAAGSGGLGSGGVTAGNDGGVTTIDDCADTSGFQGGAGALKILYPYEGTVFPRRLAGPVLQWDAQADDVLIEGHSRTFSYVACPQTPDHVRYQIPLDVWSAAGAHSEGASDPLTLKLTARSGGQVIGSRSIVVLFAPTELKGSVYYDTYTSPQANNNGAVMRLLLGDATPEVYLTDTGVAPLGPCWSCHSVAASGKTLVASHSTYPGGPYYGASFDLVANPGAMPPMEKQIATTTADVSFAAVYPNGTRILTNASPGDTSASVTFPDAVGNVPGTVGPLATKLLDPATGTALSFSRAGVTSAKMPSFSPDGTLVAFNWHEDSNGHTLAVANYDNAGSALSNVRVVFKDSTRFPGWPSITPDNREVVFVLGNTQDYVSSYPGRTSPLVASSDLWIVDIATGTARQLYRANGYAGSGSATYLPAGARDEHLEFFPALAPISSGGYYWLFFTSRRTYGNVVTNTVDQPATKKIWVSAVDARGSGPIATDPSHPAFYLPGQEQSAGNHRPVFVPAP